MMVAVVEVVDMGEPAEEEMVEVHQAQVALVVHQILVVVVVAVVMRGELWVLVVLVL
jgi:hypothetical protein